MIYSVMNITDNHGNIISCLNHLMTWNHNYLKCIYWNLKHLPPFFLFCCLCHALYSELFSLTSIPSCQRTLGYRAPKTWRSAVEVQAAKPRVPHRTLFSYKFIYIKNQLFLIFFYRTVRVWIISAGTKFAVEEYGSTASHILCPCYKHIAGCVCSPTPTHPNSVYGCFFCKLLEYCLAYSLSLTLLLSWQLEGPKKEKKGTRRWRSRNQRKNSKNGVQVRKNRIVLAGAALWWFMYIIVNWTIIWPSCLINSGFRLNFICSTRFKPKPNVFWAVLSRVTSR